MNDVTKFKIVAIGAMVAVVLWFTCGVAALFAPVALADTPGSSASATAAEQPGRGAGPQQDPGGDRTPEVVPAVAIVVPTALFATVFGIVIAGFYASYRRERQRHETLRVVIERGGDIPHELLVPPGRRPSDLRRGVILLAGGVGLSIVLAAVASEKGVWTAGLIPALLGVGYLIVWKLEPPPAASDNGSRDPRS